METNFQNVTTQVEAPVMALAPEPRMNSTPAAKDRTAQAADEVPGRRLVYLLSRFPAVSHTFFLNEVLELRKLGFTIEVASINDADIPASPLPGVEAEEKEKTFYVKSAGAMRAIATAAKALLLRPRVFIRGLMAALRMGRLDPSATLYALFYFVEALILGEWMRSRGHRHLHIHFCGPVATVGMLTSIAWGFSYSLTVHGPDEFYDVDKFYLRQKVERAKFILCISDFCRSQLMRIASPEHWDKMHVVRLGVNPLVFFPTRLKREPADVLEILCVGRLVPSKGQLILLQACDVLLSQGYALRIRLVGAGPDRQHLEAFAAQKSIPVVFEGAKSHAETRQLLGRADIFALASFAEGVPVALMEAMAMEIPCVSTNIAGIPELIRDNVDGLLVPASSVESLASTLQRLLEDPLLRHSLGIAGSQRVFEHYNLPRNVVTLARVFNQNLPDSV